MKQLVAVVLIFMGLAFAESPSAVIVSVAGKAQWRDTRTMAHGALGVGTLLPLQGSLLLDPGARVVLRLMDGASEAILSNGSIVDLDTDSLGRGCLLRLRSGELFLRRGATGYRMVVEAGGYRLEPVRGQEVSIQVAEERVVRWSAEPGMQAFAIATAAPATVPSRRAP